MMGRRRVDRVPDEPLPRPGVVVPAGPGVADDLVEQLAAFTESLDRWPGALHQLGEAELTAFVGDMLGLSRRAETLAAVATTDATDRGVVACAQAAAGRGVDPAVVQRVGFVANACTDPRNRVILGALAAGAVTVNCARATLRQLPEVLPLLPGADRDEVTSWYLALTDHGSAAMKELTARVMGRYAPQVLEHLEERQQTCETLTMRDLPNNLIELVAHLSRGHAATVRHAIEALAAPAPARSAEPGGESSNMKRPTGTDVPDADVRTPGKRRADALLQLIDTGARAIDEGRPAGSTTGGATVVVTVDHDTLVEQLNQLNQVGAGSRLPGVGRTHHGDLIDAGTVRRLACNATVIPMVLGSQSEPLDVGRAKRLFTGGLRTAIVHRDAGCTFPGCQRPPDWCDAHHVVPWWAGGQTNLANAALLCARHHSIVHRDHLTATVTTTGVTWDTTPGRMASGAA